MSGLVGIGNNFASEHAFDIGEPELETAAAKEGNHAVKNAFGNEGVSIDYDAVPAVVFTSPEIASVGVTELEYMDEHGICSCRTV